MTGKLLELLTDLRDSRVMRLHGDAYMPRIDEAITALAPPSGEGVEVREVIQCPHCDEKWVEYKTTPQAAPEADPYGDAHLLPMLLRSHRNYLVRSAELFPEGSCMASEIDRMIELADKLTAAAAPSMERGDIRGVDAERREDMSPTGRLRLHAQDDGDMCIMVIEDDGTSAGVEFCASGGKSPRTLQALRDLSRAMQSDNDAAKPASSAVFVPCKKTGCGLSGELPCMAEDCPNRPDTAEQAKPDGDCQHRWGRTRDDNVSECFYCGVRANSAPEDERLMKCICPPGAGCTNKCDRGQIPAQPAQTCVFRTEVVADQAKAVALPGLAERELYDALERLGELNRLDDEDWDARPESQSEWDETCMAIRVMFRRLGGGVTVDDEMLARALCGWYDVPLCKLEEFHPENIALMRAALVAALENGRG